MQQINTYISTYALKGTVHYSVFNSLGQLMLYTTNRSMAEIIARSFESNPSTRVVTVDEARSSQPKRA
jgi:hypothetical protein